MYRPNQPEQREPPRGAGYRRAGEGSLLDLISAIEQEAIKPGRMKEGFPGIAEQPPVSPVKDIPPSNGTVFLPGLHALGEIGIHEIFLWLRNGLGLIVAAVVLCIALALAYAMAASPRYTVYTDIVVDPSNLNVVSDDVFTTNPQRDAQLLEVESKLRVLTSRNVLARVVDDLDLASDLEFVKPGFLAPVRALFSSGQGDGDNRLTALRALSKRVEARREERSFVVVMKVWTEEPEKSVVVSNAIVEAFESELFQSAAESAGRVVKNLNDRLDELRRNVTEAERKVEDFRRESGLLSSNGELISTQLSGELNTQVLEAQQRFIQAESLYRQMQEAIDRRQTASASIFESATMTSLREQHNVLQQQIGAMQRTYGTRHPRMTVALSEKTALEVAMAEEARRIFERARVDFNREQTALETLRSKASDEKSNAFTDHDAQVRLRDLERDARAKAAIYETHLTRAQQIAERQQIDTTNVRVISRAVPPDSRSWPPRTLLLLIGGGILGSMAGVGAALMFGLWRYIRSPRPQAV